MKTEFTIMRRAILAGAAGAVAVMLVAVGGLVFEPQQAVAFPAYAQKTGFTCGICHTNPKGGGALNPYGIKWVTSGMKAKPKK
jgi:hypothetical protein